MKSVLITLGLLVALVAAAPAPAGQVARPSCAHSVPAMLPATPTLAPPCVPATTTFTTPDTEYSVLVPGQTLTVATPAPVYAPAVGYAATPAVDVHVDVLKKARVRTWVENRRRRHATVVATPASYVVPVSYAPTVSYTPAAAYVPAAAPLGPCEIEGLELD